MSSPEQMSAADRFFANEDVLRNVFEMLEDHDIRNVFTLGRGGASLSAGLDVLHSRKSVPRVLAMRWGEWKRGAYSGQYKAAVRNITLRDPIRLRPYHGDYVWAEGYSPGRWEVTASHIEYLKTLFWKLQVISTSDDSDSPWALIKQSYAPPGIEARYAYRIDVNAKTLDVQEDRIVDDASDAYAKWFSAPVSQNWPGYNVNHTMTITFTRAEACTGEWLAMVGSDTKYRSMSTTPTRAIVCATKVWNDMHKRSEISGNAIDTIALGNLTPYVSGIRTALATHAGAKEITIDQVSDYIWYRGDAYVSKHPEWDALGMAKQLRVITSVMDPPPLGFVFQIVNHVYRYHETTPGALVECRLPYRGVISDLQVLGHQSGATLTRLQLVGLPSVPLDLPAIVAVIHRSFPALRHLDLAWPSGFPTMDCDMSLPHVPWQGPLDTLTLRLDDKFRQSRRMIDLAKSVASLCSTKTVYLITGDHLHPNYQGRNGCDCLLCRDFAALMRWMLSLPEEQAAHLRRTDFESLEVHHVNGLRRWEQLEFDDENKPIPLISLENLALIDKLFAKRDGNGPRTAIQAERTLAHIRARLRDDPRGHSEWCCQNRK